MSGTVTLSRGGTTIALNGPSDGLSITALDRWVSALSQSYQRWVYRSADRKVEQVSVNLTDLTAAQWADLEYFFDAVTEGPRYTFTYTHTSGESFTARFLDGGLSRQRVNSNVSSVTLRLEREVTAASPTTSGG